jgi:hypothetical protein
MTEFNLLNKNQLLEFIGSKDFYSLRFVPLTKQRAWSHLHNPRLLPEDIMLITASQDGKMVGYLGMMPDQLITSDNKSHRMVWPTCMWVDPEVRGGGIAQKLINKGLEVEGKLVITDFVPGSRKIYERCLSFNSSAFVDGVRLYVQMDLQTILPPKKPVFQKIKPLLKTADALFNILLKSVRMFRPVKQPSFRYEFINYIDEETGSFIEKFQQQELFRRGAAELNWILKYPWMISAPEKDFVSRKYYFSSLDKSFEYFTVNIRDKENTIIAFLLFTRRNRTLKLPYAYFDPSATAEVTEMISYLIRKLDVSTFTTYHSTLTAWYLNNKAPGFFRKSMRKEYLISDKLSEILKHTPFSRQDGDGDCAFT